MPDYTLLQFPISQYQVNRWKSIDRNQYIDPFDCTINVLSFFKIIDDKNALSLSDLKNQTKRGNYTPEVIFFLKSKFPKSDFISRTFYSYTDILSVFQEMKPGHGIITLFGSQSIGHAVIFAKSNQNILFLLDPQLNTHLEISSNHILENYVKEYDYMTTFGSTKIISDKPKTKKKNVSVRRKNKKQQKRITKKMSPLTQKVLTTRKRKKPKVELRKSDLENAHPNKKTRRSSPS